MAGTIDKKNGGSPAIIASINVTPLVDVVLVLLIIFMVTSTYIVAQTLKVELPRAKSSDGNPKSPSTLMLLKDGQIRFDDQTVTESEVAARIERALGNDPELELVISADESLTHGRVVHFIDIAKLSGVTKFAINVQHGE